MQNLQKRLIAIFALVVIILVILFNSLFIVGQTQRAIQLRFNKVIRDSAGKVEVFAPGLHFKTPFINRVIYMDARLQTLDDPADRFLTSEKKDVIIDSYVKWKIHDFEKFYITTGGSVDKADNLLRRKINDRLRSQVAQQTIVDIVSGSRSELMSSALKAVNSGEDGATDLGIEVIDVRINKIELPDEVSSSIYQRMRAERLAIAGEHRAKGKEEAARIVAETDRNVQIILSNAQLQAQKIKAQADAQAAQIYNQTYAQSPELFNFLQTLEAYRTSLANHNSVLVFNPQTDGFYANLFTNQLVNNPGIFGKQVVTKPVEAK